MSEETNSHFSISQKPSTVISNSKSGRITETLEFNLNPLELRKCIQRTIKNQLGNQTYQKDSVQSLVKDLAEKVKSEIKLRLKSQYKVIAQVMISENGDQGFRITNKCLWDAQRDMCFAENFINDSLFAVVLVYLLKVY